MARIDDDALAREWHDLMARYQRITCVLDRELQLNHDLTASEFEVLQQLHAARGHSMRMHDLGEQVHVTQSALSRLITRLERAGLIERTVCADDRRCIFATLTEAGGERYLAARPTQRAVLRTEGLGCLGTASTR